MSVNGLLFLLILLVIIMILWNRYKYLFTEEHPFDQYAKLRYYEKCEYNKGQCIDILDRSRTTRSNYNPGEICVVTVSIGDRKFCKITNERMIEYCNLYRYDMKYYTKTLDDNYPIMWQKCVALDKVLNITDRNGNYKYKVVAWFDDDIYITNMKYRLEDFININGKKDIIFPRDFIKYNYNHYINAGSYIMKNTAVSRDFMRDTLKGMNGLFDGYFIDHNNHEQSINTYLYFSRQKYADAIEVLPYGVLQSFYPLNYTLYQKYELLLSNFLQLNKPWTCSDFSIHFASMDAGRRYKLCKEISAYDEYVTDETLSYPHTYSITNKYYKVR